MSEPLSFHGLARRIAQGDVHIATFFTGLKTGMAEVETCLRSLQRCLDDLSRTPLTLVQRQLVDEMRVVLEKRLMPPEDLNPVISLDGPPQNDRQS